MHAVILAGGLGTRLQSSIGCLPKPMAPVSGRPFLAYLLDYLASNGIERVILSVCYQWEIISQYFQSSYAGIKIDYVVEDKPLGTGGAVVNVVRQLKLTQPVFVLNGDTFAKVDYRSMYSKYTSADKLVMALCVMPECSQYGVVRVESDTVVAFEEKMHAGPGYINAGVYLLHPRLFDYYDLPQIFSLEKDFLQRYISHLKPAAVMLQGVVVDIGTPISYHNVIDLDLIL